MGYGYLESLIESLDRLNKLIELKRNEMSELGKNTINTKERTINLISKITNGIKRVLKSKPIIIIGIAILVILPIFILNEAYKIGEGYITLWSAADAVGFYVSLLSAGGAIFLGYVAIRQNNRLMKLEEKKFKIDNQPFVTLTECRIFKADFSETINNQRIPHAEISPVLGKDQMWVLSFDFTNTGNGFTIVNYVGCDVVNNIGTERRKIESLGNGHYGTTRKNLTLQTNESGTYHLLCTKDKLESFKHVRLQFKFVLENKFNNRYVEEFVLILIMNDMDKEDVLIDYSAQEYNVTPC